MNKYKASIIGCGKIAGIHDKTNSKNILTHASAYFNHDKFELIAVCDQSDKNLKKFSDNWDISNKYQNLNTMLKNESPHVLSICSPTGYHYEHLMTALDSNWVPKIIFLEKPCCDNKNEYKNIINRLQKVDCKVIVNHIRRFCKMHKNLKNIIKDESLGKLLSGKIYYYGDWMTNGCHIIDTLFMFFEEKIKIKKISEVKFQNNNRLFLDLDLLINKSKIKIRVFDERYYQVFESDFFFENGRVRLSDFGSKISIEKSEKNNWGENILNDISGSPFKGIQSPLYFAVEKIFQYLENGTKSSLFETDIKNIEHTMNIIWDSRDEILKRNNNYYEN